jgi:protein STU2
MTARNSQQQQKLRVLENQLEMTKKAHSNAFVSSNNDMPSNVDISMDESSEINRRISILSIDSKTGEPRDTTEKPKVLETQSSTLYNIDDKDDGWIRATAITNDLKAKIQRMKARTRTLGSADE